MKNTIKNEARTSLMTTLTAVRAARKDAKVEDQVKITVDSYCITLYEKVNVRTKI